MGLLDQLAGNSEEKEERPRRGISRSEQKDRNQSRRGRSQSSSGRLSKPQKNLRPPEVSERVWGLAEQWLEMGEGHFGKNLQINREKFSKRLAVKIQQDPILRKWLRRKPEYWAKFGRWEDGYAFVNEVLAKMLDLFWEHITEGQKNTPAIQFDFLDREWDEWVYQAVTAVQVAWLKQNETWAKPELPSAVFDPSTVGRPDDDEPCTDPEFPGMTWGEVRALRAEDSRDLPSLTDEEIIEDEDAEHQRRVASFARLKHAILANRETTTKENRND